jgi:hypothetical protein
MLLARIRSRGGNLVLTTVGVVYFVAAIVLSFSIITNMGSPPSLRELLVVAALLIAAACGAWFALSALDNLGIHLAFRVERHNTPRPV